MGYAYFVITTEKQRQKSCIQVLETPSILKNVATSIFVRQDVDTVAALQSQRELGALTSKRSFSEFFLFKIIFFLFVFCCLFISYFFGFWKHLHSVSPSHRGVRARVPNTSLYNVYMCRIDKLLFFSDKASFQSKRQLRTWCKIHDRFKSSNYVVAFKKSPEVLCNSN